MAKQPNPPEPADKAWRPNVGDRVVMTNGGGAYTVVSPQNGDGPYVRLESKPGTPTILVKLGQIEPAKEATKADDPNPEKAEAPKKVEPTDAGAEAIEWRVKMKASAAEVKRLERIADEKADIAKRAKKAFEAAASEHFDMELAEPKPMPLFDGKAKTTAAPAPAVPKVQADADDEAGLAEPVAKLSIAPGIVKKLEDAGLKTIGAIAGWTKEGRQLVSIPGLGKSSSEVLEAALAGFWDKRRQAAIPKAGDKVVSPPEPPIKNKPQATA